MIWQLSPAGLATLAAAGLYVSLAAYVWWRRGGTAACWTACGPTASSLTAGMGIPRRRRPRETGSLESMPDPVNQTRPRMVDGPWRRLGAVLWPARCLACGEAGSGGLDLCRPCRATLPWNRRACGRCAIPLPAGDGGATCGRCLRRPPPLDQVRSACLYGPPLDRWLPRFKFHQDLAAGRLLARLLAESCAQAPRPQALVPVPLHRARLRRRGYDQALELARPLAQALDLPLRQRLLRAVEALVGDGVGLH